MNVLATMAKDPLRSQTPSRFAAALALLAFAVATHSHRSVGAAEERIKIDCQMLYETADGIYVDVGTESGLKKNSQGWLEMDGRQLARIEIVNVASRSTFLRLLSDKPQVFPRSGDRLSLTVSDITRKEETDRDRSPTLKGENRDGEFVPLLAPPDMGEVAETETENVFHGRLSVRQLFQLTSDDDVNAFATHVGSSGSIDRIRGTPWSLEWSGNVIYRDGVAFEDTRDFQEPRLELYRLVMSRRFDDHSFVRIGRFIPRELPSVGFLDGAQVEKRLTDKWHLGAMVGLKPTRSNLDLSVKEPTAATYTTVEAGGDGSVYYSGTAGVLFSLFDGEADRLAVLSEQLLQLGRLSILSSAEVDIDVGGAEARDGPRLTRLDIVGSYPFASWFTLRAGVDRFELPDTAAQRSILPLSFFDELEFLDRGYWRYFVGASHDLPLNLRLSEEISVTDSEVDDYSPRWNVSLTRFGLPFMSDASATITVFNFESPTLDGFGGRLSAHLPFLKHRLLIDPSVSFRLIEMDGFGNEFEVVDTTVRTHWVLSSSWTLSAGVSYAFTDEAERALVDFALTFRW